MYNISFRNYNELDIILPSKIRIFFRYIIVLQCKQRFMYKRWVYYFIFIYFSNNTVILVLASWLWQRPRWLEWGALRIKEKRQSAGGQGWNQGSLLCCYEALCQVCHWLTYISTHPLPPLLQLMSRLFLKSYFLLTAKGNNTLFLITGVHYHNNGIVFAQIPSRFCLLRETKYSIDWKLSYLTGKLKREKAAI